MKRRKRNQGSDMVKAKMAANQKKTDCLISYYCPKCMQDITELVPKERLAYAAQYHEYERH